MSRLRTQRVLHIEDQKMALLMQELPEADVHSCRYIDAGFETAFDCVVLDAYFMATHSNGISALQLKRQLALGSYRTAWLLLGKLRASMVDFGRNLLSGLVEIDETSIRFRARDEEIRRGRSPKGKLMIAGAVEVKNHDGESYPGRIRLSEIPDCTTETLHDFVENEVAYGSTIKTDGLPFYNNLVGKNHYKQVVGNQLAHNLLPWIHRIFSNFKAWEIGVYHGLRAKHLQSYLDEFVFRFDQRRNRHSGLKSLLNLVMKSKPMTYNMLIFLRYLHNCY